MRLDAANGTGSSSGHNKRTTKQTELQHDEDADSMQIESERSDFGRVRISVLAWVTVCKHSCSTDHGGREVRQQMGRRTARGRAILHIRRE